MRYQQITVAPDINVSSSGHYFATVHYTEVRRHKHTREGVTIQRRFTRTYCLQDGFEALTPHGNGWRAPDYLVREVERQLSEMILGGTARFYEYTQDGDERYTDLRYYDADYARSLAERMGKVEMRK